MPEPTPRRYFRSDERGTAIFVVVLVVTLLTGIGLFAARVTGSVDAATGHVRQAAQVTGLALYAAQLAPVQLAIDTKQIKDMVDRSLISATPSQCQTNRFLPNVQCHLSQHLDLASLATRSGATDGLLAAQKADAPGSLGASTGAASLFGIEGNLRLEYFERGPAPPIPGTVQDSNNGTMPSDEYSITAYAQIRPVLTAPNPQWCSPDATASNANVQAIRLYVIAPPSP